MSVASKNLFALLDEDVPETQSAPPSKQDSSPAQNSAGNNRSQNQQRGRGPASRGGRYYQRGGKSTAATTDPAASAENAEENGSSEPRKRRDGDPRGRGRGGRGGRGRGRDGGRGREFDRHSGTLPDSEKRVHQGWGGDDGDRELQNEQAAIADANVEVTGTGPTDWAGETTAPATADWADTGAGEQQADDWGAAPATDVAPTGESKDPLADARRRRHQEEEEEDNTVTLDQYLAQKKQASADLPKLEGIRKANEGSDESLWKAATHNGKGDEDENYFVGKTKSTPKSRSKKAEKEFIEIEARFERPSRGGRGGRGRGGDDRRGRGRGGNRNANRNAGNTEVDVADEAAFPSLS